MSNFMLIAVGSLLIILAVFDRFGLFVSTARGETPEDESTPPEETPPIRMWPPRKGYP